MKSIRMLAAVTGALVLGSACGGDGGTGPTNPPVANFTAPACAAGTACTFTDASTDNVAVTAWDWDFGDGTTHATTASPSHTYAAPGTFNVKLTVTDGDGLTGEKTVAVTVTAVSTVVTAGFTYSCTAGNCTFTNTSSGDYRFIRVGFRRPRFRCSQPVEPDRPNAQLHSYRPNRLHRHAHRHGWRWCHGRGNADGKSDSGPGVHRWRLHNRPELEIHGDDHSDCCGLRVHWKRVRDH